MSKCSIEERVSRYIDALNDEWAPNETTGVDPELGKLLRTARWVKTLGEPELPDEDFPQRIARNVAERIRKEKPVGLRFLSPMRVAAALLFIIALISSLTLFNRDVVYAMERAVSRLSNYHGVIEMRTRNAAGEEWLVRKAEIWSEGEKYMIKQDDGTLIVNNGDKKWQVTPQDQKVTIFPLFPDTTFRSFDLMDEAKMARKYPHTIIGKETVAGREATKIAISPPGGMEYYLWVDTETNLPVRLQTAMQNALQTTYTFLSFEPNIEIKPEIFSYQVPEGYQVVEDNPGQLVATVEEAVSIAGFVPLLPETAPRRILAFKDRIMLDYTDIVVTETPAMGEFELAPGAALGSAGGGPLEIFGETLRWRQNGIEILVEGENSEKFARQFASDISIPETGRNLSSKAQISIPVDMEVVEASQKQVDRGSSPWQLDPLQVALTFVNLKVTPEGIQGEPEIPISSFELVENNTEEAVVEISEGPVRRVYLKRLIRKDETGIWTVVGYDPRQ